MFIIYSYYPVGALLEPAFPANKTRVGSLQD